MSLFSSYTTIVVILLAITTQNQQSQVHSKPEKHISGPTVKVTKRLSFQNFNHEDDMKLLGSAYISKSQNYSLQIPNPSEPLDLNHQAGKALYTSPIRLYDPQSDTPASFRTTFYFQFQNISKATVSGGGSGSGSGLTFIIVPDEFTVGRPGPWLGMINDACDDDFKAVAIEFDTRFNPEFGDPSDNHVGVNLGTMVSARKVNASRVGVSLADGKVHRASISYKGPTRFLEIVLGPDSAEPVFSGWVDIAPFLNEYMFVGFSASTGNSASQIHIVSSWEFSSTSTASLRFPSEETCEGKIAIGGSESSEPPGTFLIFTAVVIFAVAILLSLYYNGRRKNKKYRSEIEDNPELKMRRPRFSPRKFTFAELSSATAGFNSAEILGSDSRGVFYRGKLSVSGSNGCQVAIKRLSPEFVISSTATRLSKEVSDLSKARHPNIVPIRGWCKERTEFMVVYELLPNGGLEKWLFGVGVLPWTRRLKVIRDIGEGLAFLHSKGLAHKNVKPSSVFLDASFRGAIGDFGLVLGGDSRRFEESVSRSVDVFEFGVTVLQIIAGKSPSIEPKSTEWESQGILELAWSLHERDRKVELIDRRMGKVLREEEVIRVMDIALVCTLNQSKGRPEEMREVSELLSSERPISELPTSRPVSLFPYSSTNSGLCTTYSCASFN